MTQYVHIQECEFGGADRYLCTHLRYRSIHEECEELCAPGESLCEEHGGTPFNERDYDRLDEALGVL